LSKLHFSSVLLFYYVRLSHILLNTVLLCYCYCVILAFKVIQGHWIRRQSRASVRLLISD